MKSNGDQMFLGIPSLNFEVVKRRAPGELDLGQKWWTQALTVICIQSPLNSWSSEVEEVYFKCT